MTKFLIRTIGVLILCAIVIGLLWYFRIWPFRCPEVIGHPYPVWIDNCSDSLIFVDL
ncbi:MAG: hypothetical protein UR98_C0001G0050 [Parcubacteria group bacterium GW2011_GWA1_36_12]|nr:MAG: hypothetical protein UR98_C0001G0050 [Parcubacteria group bacterium GW2011_GWA1_36_12]